MLSLSNSKSKLYIEITNLQSDSGVTYTQGNVFQSIDAFISQISFIDFYDALHIVLTFLPPQKTLQNKCSRHVESIVRTSNKTSASRDVSIHVGPYVRSAKNVPAALTARLYYESAANK